MNLDKKKMTVIHTAENGKVNRETRFYFRQTDSVVTAHYRGGKIAEGYLVGTLSGEHLDFRYAQLDTDGVLDGGVSRCELRLLENGKIRLVEHFHWESQEGAGENIFEEL